MTFDAREAVASAQDDYPPFVFTGLDGQEYELPNVLTLSFRQAERLQEDPKSVIGELAPDAFGALQEMPLYAWQSFGEAWQAHGEAAGNSPSRSRSTRPTAKPSKRTSPSAA